MATYYTNSNQRDATPALYLRESMHGSFPETPVLSSNMMLYMNPGPYTNNPLGGNSQQQSNGMEVPSVGGIDTVQQQQQQQQEILSTFGGSRSGDHDFTLWRDGRNEMLLMPPLQNSQGQGLSLSLGTQIPSGIHMPSVNLGSISVLGPIPMVSGEGGGRTGSERSRNTDCAPAGFAGGDEDVNKGGDIPYGMSSIVRVIPNSRYLKAAQQLLDEIVNVRKALKRPDDANDQSRLENQRSPKDADGVSKNEESSNPQESASNSSELSPAEKQDLQNKLSKLLSMLDEVDKRYKQYYHQMQIMVQSFDSIAGSGAAKPYTALALQRISRHFRCLHDAITGQIQAARKSLGEQDASNSSGISRLRYVDQHLRQQRAMQHLGMMQQHAWRPQRGLPENSVSILRAWLFEHFLHPYPKDSDKITLARQTGLTRSQVSNWFINARVRLWKPMVEEMYKEEIGDPEMDSNSSSETVAKATGGDGQSSEDKGEDLQQSATSMAAKRCGTGNFMDIKPPVINPEMDISGPTFNRGAHGEVDAEYGFKLRGGQIPSGNDGILFSDGIVQSEGGNNRFMAAATAAYNVSNFGQFGGGSGVSLTLGLQHCDGGDLPISSSMNHGIASMRGDGFYNAAASSVGAETMAFEGSSPGGQQHRLASNQLFHDFVA